MPNRKLLLARLPTWNGTGGRGARGEKNGRAMLLPSQNLSANREVGKSAGREGNG
jgi:hypothetical protein